jgi:hypothetical protein
LNRLVSACVVIGVLGTAAFVGRKYLRVGDPEKSNIADTQSDASEDPAPEFYVSDPALLHKTEHKIEELIRADDKSPLSNAPYFLVLNDGRFAFGYSDELGKTRPMFVEHDVPYQIYLYDDAWEQWNLRKPDAGRITVDAHAP